MKKSEFISWIDPSTAAQKQHAEMARLTGIGTGRMLDIGSGDGAYLGYFQKNGWECLGIEDNEQLATQAFDKNEVLALQGQPNEVGLPRNSYDVVRLRGLLNEVDSPSDLLQVAFRAVAPTGYVIAETWNRSGWPLRSGELPLHHSYSKESLTRLFKEAGFDVGGIIAPALGDEIWFPVSQDASSALNVSDRAIDKVFGFLDRGSFLVVFAQRPPDHHDR